MRHNRKWIVVSSHRLESMSNYRKNVNSSKASVYSSENFEFTESIFSVSKVNIKLVGTIQEYLNDSVFELQHNEIFISEKKISVKTSFQNIDILYFIKSNGIFVVSNDILILFSVLKSFHISKVVGDDINIEKINRNTIIEFSIDLKKTVISKNDFDDIYKVSDIVSNYNEENYYAEKFINDLSSSIEWSLNHFGEKRIGVMLSGGIDSGIVTYLLREKFRCDVIAFTLGTSQSNEVSAALELTQYLDIKHIPIFVRDSDLVSLIPKTISYLGVNDKNKIDISLPIQAVLRELSGRVDLLFTGYGNDLINGGLVKDVSDYSQYNRGLYKELMATTDTNELSTRCGLEYGIEIIHPYWSPQVISTALSVPGIFRTSEGREKAYLRKWYSQKVPKIIAWREKIAVNSGTSIQSCLSNYFGWGENDVSRCSWLYEMVLIALSNNPEIVSWSSSEIVDWLDQLNLKYASSQ